MKFKIWVYQNCFVNKGALEVYNRELDQEFMATLRIVPHSTHEIDLDIAPLEIDYDLANAQFKEQKRIAQLNELQEKINKLSAA